MTNETLCGCHYYASGLEDENEEKCLARSEARKGQDDE